MRLLAIAVAAAALATQAEAAPVTFDFLSPAGDLGSATHTYTSGGLSITATGFTPTNTPTNLFGKTAGGDENGLGLADETVNEINLNSYVQIDVSAIDHKTPGASFAMNSTTGIDAWEVLGTNTSGSLLGATLIASGADEGVLRPLTSWGSFKFYDFVETGGNVDNPGNVLIKEIVVSVVPEPATWAMLLTGILGLGMLLRSRRGLVDV